MNERILFVVDEQNALRAYQRSLRKELQVDTAAGGMDGLVALANRGPYAIIVADLRMPGMDGFEFLAQTKKQSPESVRIMLVGNANQQIAIDAVNEGSIFRFLTKPCPPEILVKTLVAGLQQYRLVMAEKELLGKTLKDSIQVLTDILSLANPAAFGRAARVRRLVKQMAAALRIEDAWQVEIAAMLSQLGCIAVPQETLWRAYSSQPLLPEELKLIQSYPQIGHYLISHIPRLEPVAEIIAYQNKLFNGTGTSAAADPGGKQIPIGARILEVALEFDRLAESITDRLQALKELQSCHDWYDCNVIKALEVALANEISYEQKRVRIHELTPKMILAEDVTSNKGLLLIAKGQEVTRPLYLRLKSFYDGGAVDEMIKVLVPVRQATESSSELAKPARLMQKTA